MVPTKSTRFREFYKRESAHYHARRYATRYGSLFRALHHQVLRDALADLPRNAAMLEVACGTGHTTELLTQLSFKPVASDLTPQMMQEARERAPEAAFIRADAFHLPFRDGTFDAVVSTRFMHLFPAAEQRQLVDEMHRVLRPGGRLVIDFDNFASRWLLAVPYFVYNVLRYRRSAPYAVYNRVAATEAMLHDAGFSSVRSQGVGGTHLVLPAMISADLAFRLGLLHRRAPLRLLAEQFVVVGVKSA